MNRKISIGAALAYMLLIAAVVFSVTKIYTAGEFNKMMHSISEREASYNKIAEIDRNVRGNFYGDVDRQNIETNMARGYIDGLHDDESRYLTAKEYEEYKNNLSGKYVGIGVVTEMSDSGYIKIKTVYPESPAEYAGLEAGDTIVKVDGRTVNSKNYFELAGSLKGEAGTKVSLVKRVDNIDSTISIIRRDVDIPTITTKTVNDHIGYIDFLGIDRGTAHQVEKAVKEFETEGVRGLIYDLRGVSSVNEKWIIDMINSIIPEGDMAYRIYKNGEAEAIGVADNDYFNMPITVIIDETTYGTPELLAAIIKEQKNCATVGVASAGKGTVQEEFKLSDGSALILTTSHYKTVGGTTIEGTGVIPQYEVRSDIKPEDRDEYYGIPEKDVQLKKAIDVLNALIAVKE